VLGGEVVERQQRIAVLGQTIGGSVVFDLIGDWPSVFGEPTTPYYIIVRLPGEPEAEFLQMLPMVPSQRQNMIAWLAARSDPPDYGKLIVYEFPKDKLVYGPFQIEARINQNTEISQHSSRCGTRWARGSSEEICW
jgi:uncharacterized membrane protein (UPF0182 family)